MDVQAILAVIGGGWVILTSTYASALFGYYIYRGIADLQRKVEKVRQLEGEK